MENLLSIDTQLLKKSALLFRAINHPFRQEILQLLHGQGRVSVTGIYTAFRIEQSVASQQLAILRKAGLVQAIRDGKNVYYAVHYERLTELHEAAKMLEGDCRINVPKRRKSASLASV